MSMRRPRTATRRLCSPLSPITALLLDSCWKPDPNLVGAGYTALHAAALRGDLATVKALLAIGANPNLPLAKGTPVRRFGSQYTLPSSLLGATPLFIAAAYLEVDIVRELLAAKADHTIAIANGTTPFLVAA